MTDLRITGAFMLALVFFVAAILMYIYVRFIKNEFKIVITGEEQSGKSVLFNKLLFNKFFTTYTTGEKETVVLNRINFTSKYSQIRDCWDSNLKRANDLVISTLRFRNRHTESLRANNILVLYLIEESNIQTNCENLFKLIQENIPTNSTNEESLDDKLKLVVCLSKRDINMSLGRVRRLKNNLNKHIDSAILPNIQKELFSNYINNLPIIEISAKEESNVELFKRILFRSNN